MLKCLSWLVRVALGHATLQEAVDWINSTRQLSAGMSLITSHDRLFTEVVRQLGAVRGSFLQ